MSLLIITGLLRSVTANSGDSDHERGCSYSSLEGTERPSAVRDRAATAKMLTMNLNSQDDFCRHKSMSRISSITSTIFPSDLYCWLVMCDFGQAIFFTCEPGEAES